MLVKVDKSVEEYIERIRDWFFRHYGFRPYRHQVISFALSTIDRIDEFSRETAATKHILYPGSQSSFNIPDSFKSKIMGVLSESRASFPNMGAVVYAAVVYRAMSLPEVEFSKTIKFRRRIRPSEKQGYINRYEQIKEDIGKKIAGGMPPA